MDGRVWDWGQPLACGLGPSQQPSSFLPPWALLPLVSGTDSVFPLRVLRDRVLLPCVSLELALSATL